MIHVLHYRFNLYQSLRFVIYDCLNQKGPNYTVDHGNKLVTRGDWKLWKINLAMAIYNSLIDDFPRFKCFS